MSIGGFSPLSNAHGTVAFLDRLATRNRFGPTNERICSEPVVQVLVDMENQDSGPRDLAQRLLKREAGDSSDPTHLAQASDRILRQLRRELVPLIGLAGYSAVLGRALRQTRRELPFLTAIDPASAEEAELKGLSDEIGVLDKVQAEAATQAILANLLGVLVEIMGWDLTYRVLGD